MTSGKAIKNILEEQINAYKTLLDLLKKERACLVDINADKIEEISKEKDTVVMRLRLLEEERVRLMKKFAEDSGDMKAGNLEELARHTGDDTFSALRLQMISLLQSIEEMNRFNSILLDRSLRHVKTSTSFFSSFTTHHMPRTTGVLLSKET
ncbi:MAG: flagellar protein FlgN [Nitrospiraceae bacterium]|nr:MAG: flagellar protein FlgN [Nitrospiraceae bacterium]